VIVVIGRVKTNQERRADLIRVGTTVARASHQEPGCISYRVYEDVEIEDEFVFVEEWESREALFSHFATPHVAAFMRDIFDTVIEAPDVKFHTIESSMDLADVQASRR
jgi:quinol monooxygenase YgiN